MKPFNRKKQITYINIRTRITSESSIETIKAPALKKVWSFKWSQAPAILSITIDGENKRLNNWVKFKQYLPTDWTLQKVIEGKFQNKKFLFWILWILQNKRLSITMKRQEIISHQKNQKKGHTHVNTHTHTYPHRKIKRVRKRERPKQQ